MGALEAEKKYWALRNGSFNYGNHKEQVLLAVDWIQYVDSCL